MVHSHRIRLLDVLRGFAIIGTLGTNIWIFAESGYTDLYAESWSESIGSTLALLQEVFVNGKFLGLLTTLFGIGLELKYRKAQRESLPWLSFYIWTMTLLFIDGLLHYMFAFEYDVLMSYAITGIIVAFIIRSREAIMHRWMKGAAAIHIIGVTALSISFPIALSEQNITGEIFRGMKNVETLYIYGGYWDQVIYRINNFFTLREEAIGILFMNIALYIIGIKLLRKGAFQDNEEGRAIRKKLLIWGTGIGVPLNMLILVPGDYFDLPVRYLFAPILSIGYIGLLALAVERGWLTWIMARFEAIGKTALSCYVLQNIIAAVLFYSWGFNFAPMNNVYAVFLTWLGIGIAMMIIAHLFIKIIGTGPLEWVWRNLSYRPFKHSKKQGS
jgi:uncharacterized protein